MEDFVKHKEKLAELELEAAELAAAEAQQAPVVGDHVEELRAAQASIAQLREQLATLQSDAERAKASIIEDGTKAVTEAREETAKLRMERDAALRKRPIHNSVEASSAEGVATSDVPTLEQEILKAQAELAEARSSNDVESHEKLSEEHAKLSSALARAMRQRRNVRT